MSPMSSKNKVPPCDSSAELFAANAPAGSAAQHRTRKASSLLPEASWIRRASSFLPAPASARINIGTLLEPSSRTMPSIARMVGTRLSTNPDRHSGVETTASLFKACRSMGNLSGRGEKIYAGQVRYEKQSTMTSNYSPVAPRRIQDAFRSSAQWFTDNRQPHEKFQRSQIPYISPAQKRIFFLILP